MTDMNDVQLLIGGQNVPASNGATFVRRNPVSGEIVGDSRGRRLDRGRATSRGCRSRRVSQMVALGRAHGAGS